MGYTCGRGVSEQASIALRHYFSSPRLYLCILLGLKQAESAFWGGTVITMHCWAGCGPVCGSVHQALWPLACPPHFYRREETPWPRQFLQKENISLRLAYSFRGLFHYCQDGKRSRVQAGMVLEKQLRVLLPHILQQGHIYDKATPSNSAPFYGSSIHT